MMPGLDAVLDKIRGRIPAKPPITSTSVDYKTTIDLTFTLDGIKAVDLTDI